MDKTALYIKTVKPNRGRIMGLGSLAPELLRTGSLKSTHCASTQSDPANESIKEELKALRKELKELREHAAMQANKEGPWMNLFLYHGYGQSTSGVTPHPDVLEIQIKFQSLCIEFPYYRTIVERVMFYAMHD
ncbi:unnamed protein product [Cuscuta europaea]|nr:unnamed protein product [Cuscuta europaea]